MTVANSRKAFQRLSVTRIHASRNDLDYWRNYFDEAPIVRLDGIIQEHVVEADTAKGFIVVEIWDEHGPKHVGGKIIRRKLTGGVRITKVGD